jgi:Fic family protein
MGLLFSASYGSNTAKNFLCSLTKENKGHNIFVVDVSRFTPAKTGELVPVRTDDGPDHAFVPAPLPPNWAFPPRLWPLLAEAREQLARLDEKGKTIQNPSLLLEPLRKREAVRSSSIEGTYTTAKELLLFELAPRTPTSRDDKANDWLEVANYDKALRLGTQQLQTPTGGLPLSKRLVCDMHRVLMTGVRGSEGAPGEIRAKHVYVGSGHRYVPPPPGDSLMKCMNDLDNFIGNALDEGTYHPLVLSYLVHYQFEAIHPFRDGNGRVGRLLLALTTYIWCGLQLPWLYMSAYFERYKDEYVDNMFRISTHGDWDRWIEFCLRGTVEQAKDALRRCEALDAYRREIQDAVNKLPRLAALVDRMFITPIFTVADVAKWGDSSPPTARRDIELLQDCGFVDHLEGGRPKYYFVPKIFSIAYREGAEQATETVETSEPQVANGEA